MLEMISCKIITDIFVLTKRGLSAAIIGPVDMEKQSLFRQFLEKITIIAKIIVRYSNVLGQIPRHNMFSCQSTYYRRMLLLNMCCYI